MIRLTVADVRSRHDLVVPADTTVAELLAVGGVDTNRYVGTTTSGAALDLAGEVAKTPGDGGVIWLFDREAANGPGAAVTPRASTTASVARPWMLLTALLVIGAALLACAALAPSPLTVSVSAAALVIGAVALLTQPATDAAVHVGFLAPVLAAGAGALALVPFGDVGAMLAGGAVAGATVACIRHARTRVHGEVPAASTGVIAVLWSVLAVLNTAAFVAQIPATVIATVQLACALPLFHYVRGAALDVDDKELIDTPYVIRDAQGIRATPPAEPDPVHVERAAEQYLLARRRSEAGMVTACALAVLSTLLVAPLASDGTVAGWCVAGGSLGAGVYFLLTSRRLRDGLSRGAALIAGTVVTVAPGVALSMALGLDALLIALVLVSVGLIVAALTVPLAKDWRSLGWSRTGDILEGILLALAPAALLYGSGIAGQILEVFS